MRAALGTDTPDDRCSRGILAEFDRDHGGVLPLRLLRRPLAGVRTFIRCAAERNADVFAISGITLRLNRVPVSEE